MTLAKTYRLSSGNASADIVMGIPEGFSKQRRSWLNFVTLFVSVKMKPMLLQPLRP